MAHLPDASATPVQVGHAIRVPVGAYTQDLAAAPTLGPAVAHIPALAAAHIPALAAVPTLGPAVGRIPDPEGAATQDPVVHQLTSGTGHHHIASNDGVTG